MARQPNRRQTTTATVVSPTDAGEGTSTWQPKTTRSSSSRQVTAPGKGRSRQTMVTAKDKPRAETSSASFGARGIPKPRGKQADAKKAPKADYDRLWDPSKGIRMPPKQTPIPETSRPDGPRSAASNGAAGGELSQKASQRASPTTPTFSGACLGNPKKAEMTYLVADTCDPDSFDRGGIVQVCYEASKSNTTPKTSPNSQERRRRNRERDRDWSRAERHWANLANDLNHPDEFSRGVHHMERQTPAGSPSPECYDEPIRLPSDALLNWLSSTKDKILGRLIYQPGSASGGRVSLADQNLGTQDANITIDNSANNRPGLSALEMLEQMMSRYSNSWAASRASLGARYVKSPTTDSVQFAGLGSQFETDHDCV